MSHKSDVMMMMMIIIIIIMRKGIVEVQWWVGGSLDTDVDTFPKVKAIGGSRTIQAVGLQASMSMAPAIAGGVVKE